MATGGTPEDNLGLYPKEVQELLDSVFPSDDPLEQANFNVTDHINKLFPTEQSLSNIDEVVSRVESEIKDLDEEIRQAVHSQTLAVAEGEEALEGAQAAIQELFVMIKNIKDRAEQSEKTVKEITRDIKQLDTAKRNLTSSITALNHLHMLVGGVDTLMLLSQKRSYSEAASLLQGVLNVMEHFKSYRTIPIIKELAGKVEEIKSTLTQQIFAEFEMAFANKTSGRQNINIAVLSEACLVADALGGGVKNKLANKFVDNQLAEYKVLFEATQDAAWLDKIDRRYAWIKRSLMEFEERYGKLFPQSWEVSECIAVEFCYITNRELGNIMKQRSSEIDVKLLLFAIQRTTNFENLLGKRLSGVTLKKKSSITGATEEAPSDIDPSNPFYEEVVNEAKKSAVEKTEPAASAVDAHSDNPFAGLISKCFESHLHIYVQSQDRNLAELIAKFQQDFQVTQAKAKEAVAADAILQSEVLPTCADLFVYYKKCLVQCSQLSTGEPMVALTQLFKKYLKEYALKLLSNNLPKPTTTTSSQASVTSNITFSTVTNLIKETTSSLKEGSGFQETAKLTAREICLTCSILCTADYCLETTQQLQEKLKQRVDPELICKIDLTPECDTFSSVVTSCIQLLVHDLISACEPAFYAMSKVSWISVDQVGDQSNYVTAITSHIKQCVPQIRDNLASVRKYFTQFCMKFANNFIPRFVTALYKCKPISTVGTEQLLLDTHSLKTLLLGLPSISSQISRKAPASYTKIVVKGMTKVEMILKVAMYPHDQPEGFVDNYISLISAAEADTFQKVLEMKGLKRSEQTPMLELFWRRQPVTAQGVSQAAAASGSTAQQTSILGGFADLDSSSKMKKLEKLIKKRL